MAWYWWIASSYCCVGLFLSWWTVMYWVMSFLTFGPSSKVGLYSVMFAPLQLVEIVGGILFSILLWPASVFYLLKWCKHFSSRS